MIGLHVFQRSTGEQETAVHADRTEHQRTVLGTVVRAYVPYEADETGGGLSGTFLGLAGNQLLKRGGYLLMGHMTGPDPLFRSHWSELTGTGIYGQPERQGIAYPDVGSQIGLDKRKDANSKEICSAVVNILLGCGPSDCPVSCDAYQTYSRAHPRHPGRGSSLHHHW